MTEAESWKLKEAQSFGPLWKYVKDDNITDVDWDSGQLWVKRVNRIRQQAEDMEVTEAFMEDFALRVGNHNGHNFNPVENVLYAETDTLRITCVHSSFSVSGLTVSIRKSLPKLRFTADEALENGYCEKAVINMLVNCVLAKKNFVFCGEPGKGKTESAKFFSSFIPPYEKVITVEDIREWHYASINPGKSCVELKISDDKGYEKALATALRLNPGWIMVAETRSREVRYLMESWSNGVSCMTTLHVNDTRKIPDRVLNMLGSRKDAERIVNQIYQDIGIGILLEEEEGNGGATRHVISQVCFFYREGEKNGYALAVEEGKLYPERIPDFIRRAVEKQVRSDIFQCKMLDRMN